MAGPTQATLTLSVNEAANTDDIYDLAQPWPGTYKITAIYFMPSTAVAINGTDYVTITISSNDGAAGSDTTVATHTTNTGGNAFVLKTSIALSLTEGVGLELDQGDGLKFAGVNSGCGAAWDGTYTVALEKIR